MGETCLRTRGVDRRRGSPCISTVAHCRSSAIRGGSRSSRSSAYRGRHGGRCASLGVRLGLFNYRRGARCGRTRRFIAISPIRCGIETGRWAVLVLRSNLAPIFARCARMPRARVAVAGVIAPVMLPFTYQRLATAGTSRAGMQVGTANDALALYDRPTTI